MELWNEAFWFKHCKKIKIIRKNCSKLDLNSSKILISKNYSAKIKKKPSLNKIILF